MAVRKVVRRSSRNVRGYMPSLKLQRAVPWESQNELKLYRVLELSGTVRTYEVQPSVEEIVVEGRQAFYFPDVQVTYRDGRTVILEVKPAWRLRTPKVAARMTAFTAQCRADGREFHVITDEDLAVEPRHQNCEELMYHRRPLSRLQRDDLQRQLQRHQPATIQDLRDLLGPAMAGLALGTGLVGVSLDKAITATTPIRLQGGHVHAHLHP